MCEKTNLFIEKAIEIHGNKYTYDKVNYLTNVTKVDIFCNTHKKYFSITPQLHLFGGMCPDCNHGFFTNNHLTIEQIQIKLNKQNKYSNLSATSLFCENNNPHLLLKCDNQNHQIFKVKYKPSVKYKCQECYKEIKSCDTESFIKKSLSIHGAKCDYSKVNYVRNNSKVEIKCIEHDEIFYQSPMKHLCGIGCLKCVSRKHSRKKVSNKDEFIKKAKIKHGEKYDYSEVEYVRSNENVKIFCKGHGGYFYQRPGNHLNGANCSKCKKSKGEVKISNILKNLNIEYVEQFSFDDCKYVRKLKYDFVVFVNTRKACIEYNGEQHYNPISAFGGEDNLKIIKLKDDIKLDYCRKNNIPLLVIHYKDFKSLEKIVCNFVLELYK